LGNIDINNEEYLTFSRLLANLLTPSEPNSMVNTRELAPGKIANEIKITVNHSKLRLHGSEIELENVLLNKSDEIMSIVFEVFGEMSLSSEKLNSRFYKIAVKYIIKKLYTIYKNYEPYHNAKFEFLTPNHVESTKYDTEKNIVDRLNYNISFEKLRLFVNQLKKDSGTHITLKFIQAINFIQNISFYEPIIGTLTSIDLVANGLEEINKQNVPIIEIIPPSFFKVDIKFKEKGHFKALSSGEKQKIYTSASLIYHLINLNSVKKSQTYQTYNYVNFIFDEIELYHHPELQRTFISNFLDSLSKIDIPNILGINCIFITHSPFILSDIPSQNILFMNDNGKPRDSNTVTQTFATNIHDLLSDDFFMSQGFTGEFAKKLINDLFMHLIQGVKSSTWGNFGGEIKIQQLIDSIGEPIVKAALRQRFDIVYKKNTEIEYIDSEINRLLEFKKRKKNDSNQTE
jgi:hypothetical protein